ncbi:MAG: HAD-IA family hydrolase, partial [Bacteroidales bacterium]|nr:HAD-IA family hydrolase [Bacteroidales bacterium]
LNGEIKGTVEIFRKLKSGGMPLYALSNWSHEGFPVAYNRYDFMKEFDGLVVSGYEKLLKPDHAIYRVLIERYNLIPSESVYIDDNRPNTDAAAELGFHAIHFLSPDQLREELIRLGLEV